MIDRPHSLPPRMIDILLVDDDEGDVMLTRKALENGKIVNAMHFAKDGVEAMEFLRQTGKHVGAPRPDLILLDLNMPRKDGREVLAEIKQDRLLRSIPVVILTTSESDVEVANMYDLQANCFVTKPVDLEKFIKIVKEIGHFWLSVVKLPQD